MNLANRKSGNEGITYSSKNYPEKVSPKARSAATYNELPDNLRPRELFELLNALNFLARLEDNWNGWNATAPTAKSIQMVEKFLWSVPLTKKHADKIEPDGEGGIHLTWHTRVGKTIITLDGSYLHLSYEDNDGNVIFPDSIPFFDENEACMSPDVLGFLPNARNS